MFIQSFFWNLRFMTFFISNTHVFDVFMEQKSVLFLTRSGHFLWLVTISDYYATNLTASSIGDIVIV